MIINVTPQRLIRAADELDRSGKVLTYTAYTIEETIRSLKHSDDESMQVIAVKLSKTVDSLERKTRVTRTFSMALYRIAELYKRTEDNVQSFEDTNGKRMKFITYKPLRLRAGARRMGEKNFERF